MPENFLTYLGAFAAVVLAFLLITWTRRSADVRPSMPSSASYDAPAASPASRVGTAPPLRGEEGRVAITHPLIRKAALRALDRGGDVTKFVHREGDTLYLSFDALPDPVQRRRALDMVRKIQDSDADGDGMDVTEMLKLLRQMFGK
jgi:hypothetical protein